MEDKKYLIITDNRNNRLTLSKILKPYKEYKIISINAQTITYVKSNFLHISVNETPLIEEKVIDGRYFSLKQFVSTFKEYQQVFICTTTLAWAHKMAIDLENIDPNVSNSLKVMQASLISGPSSLENAIEANTDVAKLLTNLRAINKTIFSVINPSLRLLVGPSHITLEDLMFIIDSSLLDSLQKDLLIESLTNADTAKVADLIVMSKDGTPMISSSGQLLRNYLDITKTLDDIKIITAEIYSSAKADNVLQIHDNLVAFAEIIKRLYSYLCRKYDVKSCPLCGKDLIPRSNRHGQLFYGCSGYPFCGYTENI